MREEADEERRLFIADSDDGLDDGLHGSSQNLQADATRAEPSSGPRWEVDGDKRERVSSHLLMSSCSVRTWFLAQAADLCRKPPSFTWRSECRTSDWTPATHTLLSLAESQPVNQGHRGCVIGRSGMTKHRSSLHAPPRFFDDVHLVA